MAVLYRLMILLTLIAGRNCWVNHLWFLSQLGPVWQPTPDCIVSQDFLHHSFPPRSPSFGLHVFPCHMVTRLAFPFCTVPVPVCHHGNNTELADMPNADVVEEFLENCGWKVTPPQHTHTHRHTNPFKPEKYQQGINTFPTENEAWTVNDTEMTKNTTFIVAEKINLDKWIFIYKLLYSLRVSRNPNFSVSYCYSNY